jgi:hypothetical protein
MTEPLRIPVAVGKMSYHVEIQDPENVLRGCHRPDCSICQNLAYWMRERALQEESARAAVEECGFAVVAQ